MSEFYLRQIKSSDAERMYQWLHDDDTLRFLRLNGKGMTMEQVVNFIKCANENEKIDCHRAVVDVSDKYLGTVSLKHIENGSAEFAISLHPDSVGKGVGSVATKKILEYAFNDLLLNRVYLNVMKNNVYAIKLYEKSGFVKYDETEEIIRDEKHTLFWYAITKERFDERENY